jgi:two-component system, NtrC family, response regulator
MNSPRATILIIDDEPIKRSVMAEQLVDVGYAVDAVENPILAEPLLEENAYDVILTDVRMPQQDGLSFLRELRGQHPKQAVIVMTAFGTVETAVEAMKLGAFDFLQKPFATEELMLKIDKLLRFEHLESENEALRSQLAIRGKETRIIGHSEAICKVLARIEAVSGSDSTVLIEGESGTGKELAARLIHETSGRAAAPLVPVSCAALPRDIIEAELFGHEPGAFTGAVRRRIGRIELAQGGTLFLDDVDDIPIELQVKLLRVLQEREFERVGGERRIRADIRVIAATKRSLAEMVAAGEFREDLFYRLDVVPLHMPPLRDRLEDIPLLVDHLLQKVAVRLNRSELTITPETVARLQTTPWPGNVRQLEHLLEQMAALTSRSNLDVSDIPVPTATAAASLSPVHLALDGVSKLDLATVLADTEARMVRWAMRRVDDNLARAAEMLGIPRSTLQYKLSKMDSST